MEAASSCPWSEALTPLIAVSIHISLQLNSIKHLCVGSKKDWEALTGKVTSSGPKPDSVGSGPSSATSWCVTWTSPFTPQSLHLLIGNMGKYWNIPHRSTLNKWGCEHEGHSQPLLMSFLLLHRNNRNICLITKEGQTLPSISLRRLDFEHNHSDSGGQFMYRRLWRNFPQCLSQSSFMKKMPLLS